MLETRPGEYSWKRIDQPTCQTPLHARSITQASGRIIHAPSRKSYRITLAIMTTKYAELNQKNFVQEYCGHQCCRTFSTKLAEKRFVDAVHHVGSYREPERKE
jgi:hypothetical protein